MFNLLNWFYSTYWYTPARNAPNNGIDIKKFIESKPAEVKTITQNDLNVAIANLHKVDKHDKPTFYSSPLLKEFDEVFEIGYKNYFEQLKLKKKC